MGNYINDIQKRLSIYYPKDECRPMARMILEEITHTPFHQFIAYKDKQLNEQEEKRLEQILTLIEQGEPIQYVLGYTYFLDLPIQTAPGILIPRPETEELISLILKKEDEKKLTAMDIGTGSGCIAIALKHYRPEWDVWAMDISEEALIIAQKNAKKNNTPISFIKKDITTNTDTLQIPPLDIIVSNPPYVMECERAQMSRHILKYEPKIALFVPDNDPLVFYNAISNFATKKLKTNGLLAFEINAALGEKTCRLIEKFGFKDISLKQDLFGRDRFIFAVKP